jgi:response regulator NasT
MLNRIKSRLKVLLVDDSPERTAILRAALEKARYDVAAVLESPFALLRAVESHQPDVIIIDTESPSRDVLEHVVMVSQDQPRPIVMFSSDGDSQSIREAVKAGVSAYVVDGLNAGRVQSIIEVAVARFDEYHRLVAELAEANLKLSERKVVDRAKGILMKSRGFSEDEAYHALRKLAMTRKKRLGDAARIVIDMEDLLA